MELETIIIILGFILFLVYFFIFFQSNAENGNGNPTDVCKCPQGCDKDGNCLQAPCVNGHIHDDKGECVCPPGMIGSNCGCDTNNYPSEIVDPCRGFGWTCETTGNTDAWVQSTAKDCDTLYKMNCNPKTGECSKDSYATKCFSDICNIKDYPDIETRNYTLQCKSNSGVAVPYCEPGCTKQPGPNDCTTCPSPNQTDKIFNNDAGVCTCDTESGGWHCDNTQLKNNCETKTPNGLCGNSEEDPQCISCGAESSAWHCSGSPVQPDCAIKIYNLQKPDKYDFFQVPKGSTYNNSTTPYPVFPTFDNDRCLKGDVPYETLTPPGGPFTAYDALGSTQGFVSYNAGDGSVKNFIDYKDAKDYCIYNVSPKSRDAEGHGIIDFKQPIPTVFPTQDTLVFEHGMGCAKPMSEFCNGQGSFTQDCWTKNGELVSCYENTNAWYKSKTGTCNCNPGYAGMDCQYSDAITCNGRGTVDFDGNCKCSSGWTGNCSEVCLTEGSACSHLQPPRCCIGQCAYIGGTSVYIDGKCLS